MTDEKRLAYSLTAAVLAAFVVVAALEPPRREPPRSVPLASLKRDTDGFVRFRTDDLRFGRLNPETGAILWDDGTKGSAHVDPLRNRAPVEIP